MMRLRIEGFRAICAVFVLVLLAGHGAATPVFAETAGGTLLINMASATYQDGAGHSYATHSNTVQTTVAQVGALVVSPKQTAVNLTGDAVPAGQNATRTFTITNSSNIPDAYRITAASVSAGTIASIAFVSSSGSLAASVGTTVSPTVQPGGTIAVQLTIGTSGIAVGKTASVTITAQTTVTGTANGLQSDNGEEWIAITSGPSITGPGGANSRVTKTVDHVTSVQSGSGESVTFDILAQNQGGAAATNVVVSDTVPAGLQPDVSSVRVGGQPVGSNATLSGQTLSVHIASLAAGVNLDVSFAAVVEDAAVLGTTFVNTASIAADGIPAMTTTPASVLIGSANVVFDGYGGANMPISGAVVTLLDDNGNPVNLQGAASTAQAVHTPQAASSTQGASGTQNPVVTGSNGVYGFALLPSQIAPGGSRFYLTIAAPGYESRRIALDIHLDSESLLYDVHATAMDNQPLAVAGGYTLTSTAVQLANVFGLFGNLPLFSTRTITVTKSADRQEAQPGDRVMYTITFGNASQAPLGTATIVDTMPPGIVYATGTARFDGTPTEPTVKSNVLTWTLNKLSPGENHTITYAGVVFPSVADGTTLSNTVGVSANVPGSQLGASASATAAVQIISGTFTQRGIITGRVFLDSAHRGHFVHGDKGVGNVRVYLEDGSSVVTDTQGRFSFPAVRPGMHVLQIDVTTIPQNMRLAAGMQQQLVHGLFDDGLLEDVNFALESAP